MSSEREAAPDDLEINLLKMTDTLAIWRELKDLRRRIKELELRQSV